MIKKLSFFLIAVSSLMACRNEKEKDSSKIEKTAVADTLSYTYDSVKVVSKNVTKNRYEGADTANATIKFPVFKNEGLNNFIKRQVFDYIAKEEKATSYQDLASSFIKGYDSFFMGNKDTPQWWFLLIDIKVLRQTENYIALKHIHSDYTGGAHGITNISFINYNPKTNQPLILDSLILPSQKTKLLSIAEAIFRKDEKISETASLEDQYFFDKGIFSLPQNFYVSDKGLVFLYNPYEIKPYASGTTTLVIPFSSLKNIAEPNTILTAQN